MPAEASPELHAGLLALLGGVVTTSIFTIGFVSHRSQNALIHGRSVLRERTTRSAIYAHDTVAHAQSYLVLIANAVLAVLAIVAAVLAGLAEGLGGADWVTLGGFCVLEAAVILLGVHDHVRVRNALNTDLEDHGIAMSSWRAALNAELRHRSAPHMCTVASAGESGASVDKPA